MKTSGDMAREREISRTGARLAMQEGRIPAIRIGYYYYAIDEDEALAKWLGLREVALHLQISHARVRQLVQTGRLPARKVGPTWVVRADDVEAFALLPRPVGAAGHRPQRKAG